ncbi:hypothetical protein A2701_03035 [Candidatus Amesbacteria bacterium RIFCSPHIGHO2_01_FULL_47_34]|uniref:Uncharacterized protein n=5 Tax=Candidatus Amesiibacteriota TaxID=1752730 RepID=A0A1F4ZXS5_9BACT|nr:MAG: hypothetical protein UY28_C0035G0009 [Candidatus Amesbacteria bacterium GW2011_GWB1_48_13]OGC99724.1 MAG: hypothetical protein A2701_03035 [Candidatus Amesbacteria bacterium RIFCSPHIGHO2_01_FULL_47_34]OGD00338.1 MAG: hypothetical protein A2972_00840 [Candidatus Amesbacteria bacterium RIFCSPLOWO2_01_FULL_47_33]OGD10224.1 MAG: hypothetical protein A2395_00520 [Candidatus Amesbacteria bacterium RIFOXYB1_FULL_47_9]
MAKRRTKKEKMIARLKRQVEIKKPRQTQTTTQNPIIDKKEGKPDNSQVFYYPEMKLPLNLVVRDLTKTVGVTILTLILQFTLAYYLRNGGWEYVNSTFMSQINKLG